MPPAPLFIVIHFQEKRANLMAGARSLFPRDPCLFVRRRFAAPLAEFLQFDLPLHHFLVFVGVIILPFADGAAEGDEGVGTLYFCHAGYDIMARGKMQRGCPEF